MYFRAITCVALSAALMQASSVPTAAKAPAVGDHVVLQMEGELARQYSARCFGPAPANAGRSISIVSAIKQRQSDGRYQVVDESIFKAGDKTKMLLLTAVVDPTDLHEHITPAGIPVHASPEAHQKGSKPATTTVESRSLQVNLSKLENVKLQTRELVGEMGK